MLALLLPLALLTVYSQAEECVSRDYDLGGTVCVCNAEYCDTISRPEPVEESNYLVYTSNKAGLRFKQENGEFVSSDDSTTNVIRINLEQKYQTVLGFGGAFTDATGINLDALDEEVQEKLLRSYFSEDGIEYNLCRVPIGGTDFSTHGYSYDDSEEEDPDLTNFALVEEDFKYKIPYIQKAVELNNELEFFASAWTAPKWMKTNGEYTGGFLKEEMYQAWADYFVKFLDSYKNEGISFWGITTGNEPSTFLVPGIKINNVGWLPVEHGEWILNNLGPTLRASSHSDIKIMALDDNRIHLPWMVDLILADNETRQYVDGIGLHWYIDSLIPAIVINWTHDHFPEKFLLATEACAGALTNDVVLGSWERGESYSVDIIEDFWNWVGGWVDWNMVLDLEGGPTYIANYVDSPIIVNVTAGEFYKQPMYYHLGHFSKFVPKGSVRIDSTLESDVNVMTVAFQTPDDGTVVVILNREEEVVPVSIVDGTRGTAQLELSEKSITTILYW